MVKDSFTGIEAHAHTGVHLIKNDGTVEFYASSKSRRNALKLKRDKRKLKWTEAYRIHRAKTLSQEVQKEVQRKAQEAKAENTEVKAETKTETKKEVKKK